MHEFAHPLASPHPFEDRQLVNPQTNAEDILRLCIKVVLERGDGPQIVAVRTKASFISARVRQCTLIVYVVCVPHLGPTVL